jgi:hypothetical protein
MAGGHQEDNRAEASMTGETLRAHGRRTPSPWVERFLQGVRPGGRILDVACGAGRHLRLALERGYRVIGIEAVGARLVPIAYEHVTLCDPPRRVQRIAAVGPGHRWLIDAPRA